MLTLSKVFLFLLTLASGLLCADAPLESLVVFTRAGAGPLSDSFEGEHLPAIRTAMESLGVEVRQIDVHEGAPAEVSITPLIVYQNHLGRSIFQGRYSDTRKVGHFVRTARRFPQGTEMLVRENAALWREGRATTAAVFKVTPLSGTLPEGHDPDVFQSAARDGIMRGLEGMEPAARVELGRADRTFYFDFHPWRAEDGGLFVSTALFSQFNCHEPLYQRFESPVFGSWEELDVVFARAAAELRLEMLRHVRESAAGDGFDPIPDTTPVVNWEALGLVLPNAPSTSIAPAGTGALTAARWSFATTGEETGAPVQFRFAPPLDNYTGEAKRVRAELVLGANGSLLGASGDFAVDATSVTMGEELLDSTVRSAIRAADHPGASFQLAPVDGNPPPLRLGEATQAVLRGTFTMAGRSIELPVMVEFLPYLADDGAERLGFTASFQIRLSEPFGISGPDGPSPANDTMLFLVTGGLSPAG